VSPLAASSDRRLTARTTPPPAWPLDDDAPIRAADQLQDPAAISASDADSSFAELLCRPAPDPEAIDAHLTPLDDMLGDLAVDLSL
jgi:hypothetical protein